MPTVPIVAIRVLFNDSRLSENTVGYPRKRFQEEVHPSCDEALNFQPSDGINELNPL